MVGIDVKERAENARDFRRRHSQTYPIAVDPKREVYGRFLWPYDCSVPYTVLVGRDGRIRRVRLPEDTLDRAVREALEADGIGSF